MSFRSCFTVTFEIGLILLMQTTNVSYKIVMKSLLRILYCNVSLKKCKFVDLYKMKIFDCFNLDLRFVQICGARVSDSLRFIIFLHKIQLQNYERS